jgi:FAD/FMN-containing dehydrogenase
MEREQLRAELAALLGEAGVLEDPADLEKYETGWRYGKGRALLVARPASTAEVSAVLALCTRLGLRVIAQGANTGLVGASVPDTGGGMLVLSLERLDRRLEVDPLERTARVDAGVLLSTLNAALHEHGLQFPVDLGADPQIGGMIATNTGGTRLLRYGDVRRNLLGLEVVLADGRVVDTCSTLRKNNTGLDFKQLFSATSGLFGVITSAVLALAPLPRQRAVALVGLTGGEAALGLLAVLERELAEVLSAFEVMSDQALAPVFAHQSRLRNPFGSNGLPPYTALVELASTMAPEFLDLPGALEATLGGFLEREDSGVTEIFLGQDEAFWSLRHHISESLRSEGKVLAFDIAVPRFRLPAFTEAVKHWLRIHHPCFRVCDFGHWGDGGTHLNLVWREGESPEPTEELVPAVQEQIFAMAVTEYAGSYSAEHGVGPHNQACHDRYTPEPVKAAARALRQHFDPGGILGTARLW